MLFISHVHLFCGIPRLSVGLPHLVGSTKIHSVLKLKTFMDLFWSILSYKKHGETILAFFVHYSVLECLTNQQTTVLELGHYIALFELNRTIC